MAWRIHDQVVRGEIDNRTRGHVTGRIWLSDRAEPVLLDLRGNAWPDMAGCLVEFSNPKPIHRELEGFMPHQRGICGDMTASRKVKIPLIPVEELLQREGRAFPFRWGNALYVEWFSEANGRVVVESHDYRICVSTPLWRLTPEQLKSDAVAREDAMRRFMAQLQRLFENSTPLREQSDRRQPNTLEQLQTIENLKREVEGLTGGNMFSWSAPDLPLEDQEQFWRNVLAFEKAPVRTYRDILSADGFRPRPSKNLPDERISHELHALVQALARRRIYLDGTNHLSDRELYDLLVNRLLNQETETLDPGQGWNDVIFIHEYGIPGHETGAEVFLRYYAGEAVREKWARDYPDDPIPPRESPPYDRDRSLPQPEH